MKYFIFLLVLFSINCHAETQERNFNKFMEGALEVYSQFKIPSKEESEKFYAFVKTKWIYSDCEMDCNFQGYRSGKEYAEKHKVVIKEIKK